MVGGFADRHVESLRLPGTGRLLQWRDDGFWRDLNDAQHRDELSGAHVPADDEWVPWRGVRRPQAWGGDWGGAPAWWMVYGELPGDAVPSVVLADGTCPPVVRVGQVWACEWRSAAQAASVRVDGERFAFAFSEPPYRRFLG